MLLMGGLILSQVVGIFAPRPRPVFLAMVLQQMQRWTGAAGNFVFFAGPWTSRFTRRYGNIEAEISRQGLRTRELLGYRLSAGQAQQLRVFLFNTNSAEALALLLDRTSRHIFAGESGIDHLTLRVVYREATQASLRVHVVMERSYANPAR